MTRRAVLRYDGFGIKPDGITTEAEAMRRPKVGFTRPAFLQQNSEGAVALSFRAS